MNKKLKKAREKYLKISKEERARRWEEFLNSEYLLTEEQAKSMREELDILRGRSIS